MNRIAIVGSREFPNLQLVREFVQQLPDDTEIITGEARGVDTMAWQTALKCDIPFTVFPARWQRHGKSAGPLRNAIIVERCDMVVAFWTGESPGTASTIKLAQDRGKPVKIIRPERALRTPYSWR